MHRKQHSGTSNWSLPTPLNCGFVPVCAHRNLDGEQRWRMSGTSAVCRIFNWRKHKSAPKPSYMPQVCIQTSTLGPNSCSAAQLTASICGFVPVCARRNLDGEQRWRMYGTSAVCRTFNWQKHRGAPKPWYMTQVCTHKHTGTQELFCHPCLCFYCWFCACVCAT